MVKLKIISIHSCEMYSKPKTKDYWLWDLVGDGTLMRPEEYYDEDFKDSDGDPIHRTYDFAEDEITWKRKVKDSKMTLNVETGEVVE